MKTHTDTLTELRSTNEDVLGLSRALADQLRAFCRKNPSSEALVATLTEAVVEDAGFNEQRAEKLARDFVAAYCNTLTERR